MAELPTGTVTFLFTDIEGSTRRWEEHRDAMGDALARHDAILEAAISGHGGVVFSKMGDGMVAVFDSPYETVAAVLDAQVNLAEAAWPEETGPLRVRMGIHTGEGVLVDGHYMNQPLNRCARLMAIGHGGQVLASGATAGLLYGGLPNHAELVDLGEHRLRDLSEPIQVFQVRHGSLPADFPPLRTLDAVPGNLPVQSTSFVGRDAEVKDLSELVRTHRLMTVTGVGGVGKTRLALQLAAEVLSEFRDGAWLVELAPIQHESELVEAVAAVFAIAPEAGRSWKERLVESLGPRKLLLVLDNCEHVLNEAALLIEALVAQCPEVTILATSREALGVSGESVWSVASLDLGPDSSAIALFIDRARAAAPGYDAGEDIDSVAEICRRLDGIPLAIELAAARVRSMSPVQIRDRLDERFRLLTGSKRSIERHQTLRQAVQWSYDLLDENERRVLLQSSVFAGGFTLAAATNVCGDNSQSDLDEFEVLDLVDSLVRKSLLHVERTPTEVRYRMLETIRQFGEEQLADSDRDSALGRHAAYFADRAEATFELLRGPQEAVAYQFVEEEMANLRAAFHWAVGHDHPDAAIRIAAGVHQAARFRLRTETFGWAAQVLDSARGMEHRQLPLLLTMASDSAWALGELAPAKAYGQEAIALADDPRFEPFVWAYTDLAQVALFEGDVGAAITLLRAGADRQADHHDRFVLAILILVTELVGEPMPDLQFAEASDAVMASEFSTARAFALSGRAQRLAHSDLAAAIELLQLAVEVAESCGNRLNEQMLRAQLVGRLADSDDPDFALESMVEIVRAWRVNGDTTFLSAIGQLVVLLSRAGQPDGAAKLYGAATRGVQLDALVPGLNIEIAQLRSSMGNATFDSTCDAGAALSYQEASDLAEELIATARAGLTTRGESTAG